MVTPMRKMMIKLVLIAFVLMYTHQAFEHHMHGNESMLPHLHDHDHHDLSFPMCHYCYIGCGHDHSSEHDHDTHLHFLEFHLKKGAQSKGPFPDLYAVKCIYDTSADSLGIYSKHFLEKELEGKPQSQIPQYLCAQSFLI